MLYEVITRNFHEALTFLTILGLIDIEKGKFLITTQGEELIHLLRGKKKKLESTEKKKCIIINPDFNLIVITSYSIHYTKLYDSLLYPDLCGFHFF